MACVGLGLFSALGLQKAQASEVYLVRCSMEDAVKKVQVDVIEEHERGSLGYSIAYSFEGPNSLGEMGGVGSKVNGTFDLDEKEARAALGMSADGGLLFQFSRSEPSMAKEFKFTAQLDGEAPTLKGFVTHKDGKPVSYSSHLVCKRSF